MKKSHYLLNEVARMIGQPGHRIGYALSNGYLPEPEERLNNHRLFTQADIEGIRKYFADRQAKARKETTP